MEKSITIQFTIFMADRKINKFMESTGVKPKFKWFIKKAKTEMDVLEIPDDRFFEDIIQNSKDCKEFWIPAISYNGKLFKDKEVKIISDGQKEMFI